MTVTVPNSIVLEINELTAPEFQIELVTDTLLSNYYLYLGSGGSYSQIFPSQGDFVVSNFGLFSLYWNGSNELSRGHMYVDTYRASLTEQKHLLREELTQSLGLAKDSPLYDFSIFQQSYSTKTTQYASIDEDLIRLLYHPEMQIALNVDEVDGKLREILMAEW